METIVAPSSSFHSVASSTNKYHDVPDEVADVLATRQESIDYPYQPQQQCQSAAAAIEEHIKTTNAAHQTHTCLSELSAELTVSTTTPTSSHRGYRAGRQGDNTTTHSDDYPPTSDSLTMCDEEVDVRHHNNISMSHNTLGVHSLEDVAHPHSFQHVIDFPPRESWEEDCIQSLHRQQQEENEVEYLDGASWNGASWNGTTWSLTGGPRDRFSTESFSTQRFLQRQEVMCPSRCSESVRSSIVSMMAVESFQEQELKRRQASLAASIFPPLPYHKRLESRRTSGNSAVPNDGGALAGTVDENDGCRTNRSVRFSVAGGASIEGSNELIDSGSLRSATLGNVMIPLTSEHQQHSGGHISSLYCGLTSSGSSTLFRPSDKDDHDDESRRSSTSTNTTINLQVVIGSAHDSFEERLPSISVPPIFNDHQFDTPNSMRPTASVCHFVTDSIRELVCPHSPDSSITSGMRDTSDQYLSLSPYLFPERNNQRRHTSGSMVRDDEIQQFLDDDYEQLMYDRVQENNSNNIGGSINSGFGTSTLGGVEGQQMMKQGTPQPPTTGHHLNFLASPLLPPPPTNLQLNRVLRQQRKPLVHNNGGMGYHVGSPIMGVAGHHVGSPMGGAGHHVGSPMGGAGIHHVGSPMCGSAAISGASTPKTSPSKCGDNEVYDFDNDSIPFDVRSSLVVSGIPKSWSLEKLKMTFEPYGKVLQYRLDLDAKTMSHRGRGFVQLESPEAARRAVEQENRTETNGRMLRVRLKKYYPRARQGSAGKNSLTLDGTTGGSVVSSPGIASQVSSPSLSPRRSTSPVTSSPSHHYWSPNNNNSSTGDDHVQRRYSAGGSPSSHSAPSIMGEGSTGRPPLEHVGTAAAAVGVKQGPTTTTINSIIGHSPPLGPASTTRPVWPKVGPQSPLPLSVGEATRRFESPVQQLSNTPAASSVPQVANSSSNSPNLSTATQQVPAVGGDLPTLLRPQGMRPPFMYAPQMGGAGQQQQPLQSDQWKDKNNNSATAKGGSVIQDNNLFIFHVPPLWNEAQFVREFSKIGKIRSLSFPKDSTTPWGHRGYGFVCYERHEDAVAAIREMDGKEVEVGRRLKVEFRKPTKAKVPRPPTEQHSFPHKYSSDHRRQPGTEWSPNNMVVLQVPTTTTTTDVVSVLSGNHGVKQ